MKVKIVLMKDGTAHGSAGATVEVSEDAAKTLCMVRERHDGAAVVKYRVARLASEKVPEVSPALSTAAEMAAAGKRNVVKTPEDTIEPKCFRKAEEAKEEKPAKSSKKGK